MASAQSLITDIRNIASSGPTPVDFRISDDEILHWINETRSMMINQAIQKRQDISDVWIQTIGCLALTEVDTSECCEVTTDCYMLRSEVQLPPTIETDGINMIMQVAGIDGSTVIAKINPFRSRFRAYNKFVKNTPGWYLKNRYLYITNSDLSLGMVSLKGIFENPLDLNSFVDCNNQSCITLESEYPMSLKMANDVTNYIINTKVKPYMLNGQDTKNNANDETGPLGGQPKV